MSSNSQNASDLQPASSGTLQPFQTGAVSRSSRTQDDYNAPGETETLVASNDELHDTIRDSRIGEDKRPWYRRPSPWWMLTLMPISAMTLAGVNPSLLQVYTELVCKDIRGPSASALAFEASHSSHPRNALHLSNYLSVSIDEDPNRHLQLHSRSETSVKLQIDEDGEEEQNCNSDPVVQAAVSKLLTALLTTQGILSCITAASWASLSDRLGRRAILTLTSSAVIACYSIFIAVYYSAEYLPGGYWVLLFGPLIYGLAGGSAGTTAATNAYISDCTPAEARAHTFSLTLGLRFTGMAIGPTLNALLVRATGTPIAALMLVVGTHMAYVLSMLLLVPESLPSEKRAENRRVWRETREAASVRRDNTDGAELSHRVALLLHLTARGVLAFLRPLTIAGPITITRLFGRVHKDWSLTFIAISAGLASIILASYTSMFQFGAAIFGWSAVELGYWYSGIVAARALTLTLILPVIIKIYHYVTNQSLTPTESQSEDVTPLLSDDRDAPSDSQGEPTARARVQAQKTPAFDLAIAQASLALEVVCYALVPVVFSRGPVPYVILTILASCGAGFGPAIQALAVDLYAGRGGTETGRLFGVLSVVQTISSQILGPTVYGITYMKIVAFYPQGIFFVSVAAVASALTFLLFVELPEKKGSIDGEGTA